MDGKLYLVLENGRVFEGKSFGAYGEATGELVFSTSMGGYLEAVTDPGFFGQIVIQTFPLLGNYGVIPSDFESPTPQPKAYIVREFCDKPSNFRNEGNIDGFLKDGGVIGVCDIDTRELTKIVREYGVMNARVTPHYPSAEVFEEIRAYKSQNAVAKVSCARPYDYCGGGKRVVLYDFGLKKSIAEELNKRGFAVTVVPYNTSAKAALAYKPSGIVLSSGPGDPQDNPEVIANIKELSEARIPIFGICLGHLILALARGGKTTKLKYGHRGENQPVKDTADGKVYITCQNHGYVADAGALPDGAVMSFINANDGTCEGLEYDGGLMFGVQFHPEAGAGPLDTNFLFDKFARLINEVK